MGHANKGRVARGRSEQRALQMIAEEAPAGFRFDVGLNLKRGGLGGFVTVGMVEASDADTQTAVDTPVLSEVAFPAEDSEMGTGARMRWERGTFNATAEILPGQIVCGSLRTVARAAYQASQFLRGEMPRS